MTQKEKLLAKFKNNPQSLHYSDIVKILNYYGFQKIEAKGSHVKWKHEKLKLDPVLPIHNNDCKDFYKIKLQKLLKSIL